MNYKLELVAPAGNSDSLDAAIGEGADAVYLGLHSFNARLRAKNFAYNQFEALVLKIHDLNKKVYLTLNTVFENWELDRLYSLLKYIDIVRPDSIIVQDLGLVKMINENFPNLNISASTQMNINSARGVNLLSRYGVKRTVLSRELSFNEISRIRRETNAELEIFAHGSLCVSLSGLCLFSSYHGGKSANKGRCTQACRRIYQTQLGKSGHFFSPSDLMLLKYIPDIAEIGINSIKLEGRMKNANYVASVVKAYRYMIDNYTIDKEETLKKSTDILLNDMARSKTTYFFVDKDNLSYINPDEKGEIGIYIGEIKSIKKDNDNLFVVIKTNSNLYIGDTIRIVNKRETFKKSIVIRSILNATDNSNIATDNSNINNYNVNNASNENDFNKNNSKENTIIIDVDNNIERGMMVYLFARKGNIGKYPHIIPNNLSRYKRHPGVHSAPPPAIKNIIPPKKSISKIEEKKNKYGDGIYVKTNNFSDLYIIQSIKPKKVILSLNNSNISAIRKNIETLPFKPNDIIIYLTPYISPLIEDNIIPEIEFLLQHNFNQFIVNNLSHIHILKNKDVSIIGGEYLYTFNKYALGFLMDLGIEFFISPLENNKKNLKSMFDTFHKEKWFITIFGYPELFQINTNLIKKYDFTMITDNENNTFHIMSNGDDTSVIPENPFSIIDKIEFLEKEGLKKFIVDISYMNVNKGYYKTIMKTVEKKSFIEKSTRFNWKNGFFREK